MTNFCPKREDSSYLVAGERERERERETESERERERLGSKSMEKLHLLYIYQCL